MVVEIKLSYVADGIKCRNKTSKFLEHRTIVANPEPTIPLNPSISWILPTISSLGNSKPILRMLCEENFPQRRWRKPISSVQYILLKVEQTHVNVPFISYATAELNSQVDDWRFCAKATLYSWAHNLRKQSLPSFDLLTERYTLRNAMLYMFKRAIRAHLKTDNMQ